MQTEKINIIDDELKIFQGKWRQVKCEANGITDPPDEFGSNPITTFHGNSYVVTHPDGTVVIRGEFTLDPSATPKAIDWTDTAGADKGKTFLSIYHFEGDCLMFCAADEGMERPKTFHTRIGDTLRIHQRIPS